MVKTAVHELELDLVKSAMQRIFGDGAKETTVSKVLAVEWQKRPNNGRGTTMASTKSIVPIRKMKGKLTTCRNCRSRFHWATKCPEASAGSSVPLLRKTRPSSLGGSISLVRY